MLLGLSYSRLHSRITSHSSPAAVARFVDGILFSSAVCDLEQFENFLAFKVMTVFLESFPCDGNARRYQDTSLSFRSDWKTSATNFHLVPFFLYPWARSWHNDPEILHNQARSSVAHITNILPPVSPVYHSCETPKRLGV